MPMYEYQCGKCGVFEIYQSIKDDALVKCPTCKSKVERLISANVGFVLKGSGFYQNDYKKTDIPKGKAKAPEKSSDTPPAAKPAHSSGPSEMGHSGPSRASGQANNAPDCSKCPGPDACTN
jgi:putative FmdB family regulatory protein